MPRILLLPLDERPCNFLYPALMVEKCTDVQLLLPPKELMGSKKRPAPFLLLAQWLEKNFSCCDYAVISIDMLLSHEEGVLPTSAAIVPTLSLTSVNILVMLLSIQPIRSSFMASSIFSRINPNISPSHSQTVSDTQFFSIAYLYINISPN